MTGLLLGVAVLAAVVVVAVRKRRKPAPPMVFGAGRSADEPLVVPDFHAVDDAVELARCGCGGLLDKLGEAGRVGPHGPIRIVRCTCLTCETDQDLFFELRAVRN